MNTKADRLQKARGPLTGIALLLIGASIALYMASTSSDAKTGAVVSSSVPTDQTLAAPSTTTDFTPSTQDPTSTTPDSSTTAPTTAPVTVPVTIPASTTTTTATTPTTSKLPATTSTTTTTTTAPTTTAQPAKVNWSSTIPSLPNGGTASCVECTSYHYAINIAYPSYQPTSLVTDMSSVFQKAGWKVVTTGTTLSLSKTGVAGSVKISSATNGSTAALDLRSV